MTQAEYYETQIRLANRKKDRALAKGDMDLAAFYSHAAVGFEIKRNGLTITQLNQLHHEIR